MQGEIQIAGRRIGREHRPFIIAEIGVTCNYSVPMAKDLIDVVADSGADAVKFIFWFPEEIMSDKTISYSYKTVSGTKTENMFEMLSKLRFDLDQWGEIKAHADTRNVVLLSTVNSPGGIAYARKLSLPAFKLSSWDYNYIPLFRKIARLGKPMLLDTGPVFPVDVIKVLDAIRGEGNDQIVLIHCFHTDDHTEMNMRAIPYMRDAFNCQTGYSAPDTDDAMDIVAITLGATVLEKRLTMKRDLPGHHHVLSKEPEEFRAYVKLVKDVHASLGVLDLKPSAGDLSERRKWFRHLVANRDLPAGTVLAESDLEGKRGETGVSPEFLDRFVGRKLSRALEYNDSLSWDDV